LREPRSIQLATARNEAQHSAGNNLLHSVQLGDLPGIGMTIIDGIVPHPAQPQHAAGN
jgi:hypothetical protein